MCWLPSNFMKLQVLEFIACSLLTGLKLSLEDLSQRLAGGSQLRNAQSMAGPLSAWLVNYAVISHVQ